MNNSPKLTPGKYDLIVVAAVLALAALLGVRFWLPSEPESGALLAVVEIDGAEVDRFALAQAAEETRTYTNNGVTLTVAPCATAKRDAETWTQTETAGVRVVSSDCPTQDCVHTGQISRAGQSIVCLPAHIVITLAGTDADYDLITG
ncbi:MAG: NusG domain II-containing protein [Oscillospiraceae bacterium]|nr:NusG domain II-containing protein [Oscillospiraceae bacterium]